ncbi:hypothetical protein LTR85_011285 [Meristemomyces frigidus]|nr:hypothetical protein LTR85_011285 [Meristemomyces frigidus]
MRVKDETIDESGNVDDFDPLVESLEPISDSEHFTTEPGLPVDARGNVPEGLAIRVQRTAKHTKPRGLVFSVQADGGVAKQVMFAEPHGWTTAGSQQTLVFERGGPSTGPTVGSVNFHAWLADQRKGDVEIHEAQGDRMHLKATGMSATHHFEMHGKTYIWRRTHGTGEDKTFWKSHLECVNEAEQVYAFYTGDKHKADSGHEITVGRFEIKAADLRPEFVEVLLMTFVAMFVKLQKRMLEESHSGIAGKLASKALYSIGG